MTSDDSFLDGFHIHVPEDYDTEPGAKLGKVLAPYGGIELCANSDCQQELDEDASGGAYMFRDLRSGKLVIFCGECAPGIELNHSDRFLLIPL
jgi:hypothetical protein